MLRWKLNNTFLEMHMKDISIEWMCDGWTVEVDGKRFSWDHNDEDMGTEAIKDLLTYLGHKVTIEESY